jgi:hypothetical protein
VHEHVRPLVAEAPERLHRPALAAVAVPERQVVADRCELLGSLAEPVGGGEDGARLVEQAGARLGELDGAAGALEQREAQLRLELADAL